MGAYVRHATAPLCASFFAEVEAQLCAANQGQHGDALSAEARSADLVPEECVTASCTMFQELSTRTMVGIDNGATMSQALLVTENPESDAEPAHKRSRASTKIEIAVSGNLTKQVVMNVIRGLFRVTGDKLQDEIRGIVQDGSRIGDCMDAVISEVAEVLQDMVFRNLPFEFLQFPGVQELCRDMALETACRWVSGPAPDPSLVRTEQTAEQMQDIGIVFRPNG